MVTNEGNATSASVRLGYYLSTNTAIRTNDIFIGSDFVGVLAPGSSSNESFNFNLSNYNLPVGSYFLGMIADYQDSDSNESNENNNTCHVFRPKLLIFDCNDGIQNGGETGVDCGGPFCEACDCMANATITSDITSDVSRHSRTWLRTLGDVKVRNSAEVYLSAQTAIVLNPGFEVVGGSVFVLTAESCAD